jgi:probable HAF family extracellular repeat protein
MTGLGFLGTGNNSSVSAVSADGSVVVGDSTNSSGNWEAFRWTQATHMQSINQWLAGAGVAAPAGWQLVSAYGVSANGTVVTGDGTDPNGNSEAWLARVSSQGSGLLTNINAFNSSLLEAGSLGIQAGADLPNLTLFGAHHRSILDNGLIRSANNNGCGWATGDVAS